MANVATVQLRLVPVAGGRPLEDAALVRALLGEEGSSYCVPLVVTFRDGCQDAQVGMKWSPWGRLDDVRALVGDRAHLFVRWFDSGADVDEIFDVPIHGTATRRPCRYAFDEVRVLSGDRARSWPLAGCYHGGNPRDALGDDVLPTPTTAAGWGGCSTELTPYEVAAELAALRRGDATVEWRFRGRAVRVERPGRPSRREVGLDDWDNCADPGYLAARGRPQLLPRHVIDDDLARFPHIPVR